MLAIIAGFIGSNDEIAIVQLENCTMDQIPREYLPADVSIGDKVKIIVDMSGIKVLKTINSGLGR